LRVSLGHRRPEYRRRAVERDVKGFVGWGRLLELCASFTGSKAERDRALFSTAFLTGGRIGEVLSLDVENFSLEDDVVVVRGMPLFKRYEKVGEFLEWRDEKPETRLGRLFKLDEEQGRWYRTRYETRRKEDYRADFDFPIDEPLVPFLLRWLDRRGEGVLFPGYKKRLSYIRSYQILTQIGIYPHWLRAQRACCIISFYGYSMEEMMEWMGWEELSTARRYAKFGRRSLSGKMRKRSYPKRAIEIQRKLIGGN